MHHSDYDAWRLLAEGTASARYRHTPALPRPHRSTLLRRLALWVCGG